MIETTTNIKTEKQLIPALRFKEFEGDWNTKKLGEIYKINAGGDIDVNHVSQIKTEEYQYPIYANAKKEKGFYAYSDIYKVEPNTVTIAGRGAHLGIAHARDHRFYPIVRLLVLKPLNQEDIHFSECAINRIHLFIESTGVPQLTAPQISGYKISLPSLPEQQKIASFLSAVDEKIQQLTKKKELLEQYKKGVMQQLFSGQLRFKDKNGNPYPDWEEKRLGEYLIHKSAKNKDLQVPLVLSVSNKKGFISQNEQFDGHKVASKDLSNYKIVNRDDIAYNPSRINVGSIARLINFEKGIVSPMYVVFSLKDDLDKIYFENLYNIHLFKHLIKVGCSGSVRDSLNFDDLCDFEFKFPSIEEQQKIATYLSSIDTKIGALNNQITQTQTFKKGLLQQMFV